ncbi:hypothetical protein SUGI_0254590 [Cryptomeria japonica]|nr:hypothetical protein SUGI_0254590 [Cryptomeria japonica]
MKAKNGAVMATLAHLWHGSTTAIGNMNSKDISTVQFVVHVRSKFSAPLPREFGGNAIIPAYAKATARELQEQPFCEIVKRVMCLENGFIVTSWLHMGGDLDLGKGIKLVCGGIMIERWAQGEVFMIDPKDEAGIMMHIALEPHHMARFEDLIQMQN